MEEWLRLKLKTGWGSPGLAQWSRHRHVHQMATWPWGHLHLLHSQRRLKDECGTKTRSPLLSGSSVVKEWTASPQLSLNVCLQEIITLRKRKALEAMSITASTPPGRVGQSSSKVTLSCPLVMGAPRCCNDQVPLPGVSLHSWITC